MARYFRPPELIEHAGRKVQMPASWADAQTLLGPGEQLAVVIQSSDGKLGLLIQYPHEFEAVKNVEGSIFVVSAELAKRAS
jgi:hypothetical protein